MYGNELTLISTWTNDILGASSTIEGEHQVKAELGSSYEIKDLGEAKLLLSIWIDQNALGNVRLSQWAYCKQLLKRFNMDECLPSTTPLPSSLTLSAKDCPTTPEEVYEMKDIPYREALELLMWLQVATRPDLSFSINLLACFAHNPGKPHWSALKHVLAYVKGTIDYRITYQAGGNLNPTGYVDSDFARCKDTRKSTDGTIFIVAGGLIS